MSEPASVMALSLLSSSEAKMMDASVATAPNDTNKKPDYYPSKELASFTGDSSSPCDDLISLIDYENTHNKHSNISIIKKGAFATYFNMSDAYTWWKYITLTYIVRQLIMITQSYWLLVWVQKKKTTKRQGNLILFLDLCYIIWLRDNYG
jgi:hypothetical protein